MAFSTQTGFTNPNGQVVLGPTVLPGTDQGLIMPANRAAWRITRTLIDGPFRKFVDKLSKETEMLSTPVDWAELWRSTMARELASAGQPNPVNPARLDSKVAVQTDVG